MRASSQRQIKVWLVQTFYPYEGSVVEGIFSSKKKADEFAYGLRRNEYPEVTSICLNKGLVK